MKNVKLSSLKFDRRDGVMLCCCWLFWVQRALIEPDGGSRKGENCHSVTLHAENHPVTAHNQLALFQKIMHALEVAAATKAGQATFPEKEKKPQENPSAVTFGSFCFCFCWVLVFFYYLEDETTVSLSLHFVQEPSKALMENEWVPDTITPSRGSGTWRSCPVSPDPEPLASSRPMLC